MLFKVIHKKSKIVYNVYQVYELDTKFYFLLYKDNLWTKEDADDFAPFDDGFKGASKKRLCEDKLGGDLVIEGI